MHQYNDVSADGDHTPADILADVDKQPSGAVSCAREPKHGCLPVKARRKENTAVYVHVSSPSMCGFRLESQGRYTHAGGQCWGSVPACGELVSSRVDRSCQCVPRDA